MYVYACVYVWVSMFACVLVYVCQLACVYVGVWVHTQCVVINVCVRATQPFISSVHFEDTECNQYLLNEGLYVNTADSQYQASTKHTTINPTHRILEIHSKGLCRCVCFVHLTAVWES
ncbi:dynactin subunit 5 [Platysternon megacephalum]|uniref:Dynactin subunit 5 n=1 Tax=Platysternon megacephalum TaxID=55544 RepID=A0A4D9EPL9_9SAUR|nr:dynactin subunit 5 [Platysternon megacephalum]